jgi:hypothetical protein
MQTKPDTSDPAQQYRTALGIMRDTFPYEGIDGFVSNFFYNVKTCKKVENLLVPLAMLPLGAF